MKVNLIYLLVIMFFLNMPLISIADAQEVKIGEVNPARLLADSPQMEAIRITIQKEFVPRDKQLLADRKKLKDLEDWLTKYDATMSESDRQKRELEIITARRELKQNQEKFREDLTRRRIEEMSKLQEEMEKRQKFHPGVPLPNDQA